MKTDEQLERMAQELKSLGVCPSIFDARKAVLNSKYDRYKEIALKNIQELKNKQETKKETTIWNCPKCTGALIKRQNKLTKEIFYGCTNYPKCKYTQREEKSDDGNMGVADAASVWE
jgi:hypothetical protein